MLMTRLSRFSISADADLGVGGKIAHDAAAMPAISRAADAAARLALIAVKRGVTLTPWPAIAALAIARRPARARLLISSHDDYTPSTDELRSAALRARRREMSGGAFDKI